jgi:halocyanin-like protein
MQRSPTRRQVLRGTAVAGLAAVAGCSASGADDSPTATSTATQTATSTPTPTTTAHTPPASVDAWIADANGYRDEVPRFGPGSQPTIAVGHPVDGGMSFDPPAIEVAPMTNVTWDWTGHGGPHNVVALDGTFDSGRPNAQAGTAYHYIFDEPGAYPFVSESHEGMRGVVFVREPPSTGNPAVDEWVVDSSNFDGSVADETGADTATVAVGAAGNRGHFAFDPPVLRVSTGTRVVWEWMGNGGAHTVRFQEIDVDSGDPMAEPDSTFEHTFEIPGTYRYACAPHRSLGMKGAIVVE